MEAPSIATAAIPEDVLAWLSMWESHIREQGLDNAQPLFDGEVHSYGTVMHVASGLPALVQGQWRVVWPRTSGFQFLRETVRGWGNQAQFVVAAEWRSEGIDAQTREPYQRQGRSTVVLQRCASQWKAIHTHFSITPTLERFVRPEDATP